MKKRGFAVLLAGVLLLSGCTGQKPQLLRRNGAFTADCSLSGDNLSVEGVVSREADGSLRMKLREPSMFAGSEFCVKDGKTTVSYAGITLDLPDNAVTAKGIAAVLDGLLEALASDGGKLSGETAAGQYQISTLPEGGVQIELPDIKLSCTLQNFQYSS